MITLKLSEAEAHSLEQTIHFCLLEEQVELKALAPELKRMAKYITARIEINDFESKQRI